MNIVYREDAFLNKKLDSSDLVNSSVRNIKKRNKMSSRKINRKTFEKKETLINQFFLQKKKNK